MWGGDLDAGSIEFGAGGIDLNDIGRVCFHVRIQRCFQGLWRETGFRVRVLVLREATVSIRMSQDEAGPRHVTVEGSEGSRQQRNEQESGQVLSQVQRNDRVRSKQEKLRRDEMRRHGERRSEFVGDWSSVVAREIVTRFMLESIRVLQRLCFRWFANEKLQVLCGSECLKGERQAPRCVILVRESKNGRDVRSRGGSVRERHESRCVLPLLSTKVPKRVRTTRDVERNWSWSQTESSNCQSRLFWAMFGRQI